MNWWLVRYLLVGLVTFLIGLVAFFPARIAAGWVESSTPVTLGGVTGTVFDGHAGYVQGPGGAIENLDWRLHPLNLLLAQVAADIEVDSDLGGFSGRVTRSLFGGTHVRNLTGSASAGWLAKRGGVTFLPLSSDVAVDIREASVDDQLNFSALDGAVRLGNTRWELFNPPVELGQFETVLAHGDDGIRATIVDSNGPLAIDGSATLTPERRYRLNVRLRARAGADDRLDGMLDQLGEGDDEGWHRVQEQGSL